MAEFKGSHLKRLGRELPEGLLVDSAWLEKKGIASNLRAYYVKAGWLEQPVRGLYRRPQGQVTWQAVVVSMQTLLGSPLVVGGSTALELLGVVHYVASGVHTVMLHGPDKPPFWLARLELEQRFVFRNSNRLFRDEHPVPRPGSLDAAMKGDSSDNFNPRRNGSFIALPWGQWDWSLTVSRPERAYLEMLDELPGQESFDHADKLMESATNFSPRRLQKLLENCHSVKVKRLFFFFADRHGHSWLKRIDRSAIDLGRGNRMLVKQGRFDPDYLITVPEDIGGS